MSECMIITKQSNSFRKNNNKHLKYLAKSTVTAKIS